MKKDGTDLSQERAARQAGMSECQTKTAVRVANVSGADFKRVTEGDDQEHES